MPRGIPNKNWVERSYEFVCTHANGSDMYGTHGIRVEDGKHIYSYYYTNIVVVDTNNCTITIDDGGYNEYSRTTGSITRILNKYCNQDYEVIDKSNRNFDMWYNTRKYKITLYDYDITTKTTDSNKLFYSRIESVPDNLTSKQFRENYFDNFIQLYNYIRMTKRCFYPPYTWINSKYHCEGGMAYRYCDQHYNHIGVILFEPIRTKLTKRTYLIRI